MITKGQGLLVIPQEHVPQFKRLLVAYYEDRGNDEIIAFMRMTRGHGDGSMSALDTEPSPVLFKIKTHNAYIIMKIHKESYIKEKES